MKLFLKYAPVVIEMIVCAILGGFMIGVVIWNIISLFK